MSFRICVIGCGSMSSHGHGPSFRQYANAHPETVLAACCDLNEERAIRYRQEFGFQRHYTDYRLMLEKEKPDAVSLVVQVQYTAGLAVDILRRGFPLIMEKPPGLDPAECRAIIAAAEEKKVPHQVAFNRRFTPLAQELCRELAAVLAPEEIQYIRYDFHRVRRFDADFSTTAIHAVDTVRFLTKADYINISFTYQEIERKDGAGAPAATNFYLEAEMTTGARAYINLCPVTGASFERATIVGQDHTFILHMPMGLDGWGRLQHIQAGKLVKDIAGNELSGTEFYQIFGFYDENAAFFADLLAGRRPQCDAAEALQSVVVADLLRRRVQSFSA
ncbi:MAG TPA: Gfo/Idh/MocA family oxidoreductase [Firmicutes bacterium]|nr:Gfo/Idh/MocA family oxidoreductase [Bacillota bacterium]